MKSIGMLCAGLLFGAAAFFVPTVGAQTAASETLIGTVYFTADSDVVTPEAEKTLDAIVARFKDPKAQRILLRGHSEPTEHAEFGPEYGVGLSQRRAGNVGSYLYKRGVPVSSYTSEAFGDSRPIKGAGPVKLRRVEVFFGPGPGW